MIQEETIAAIATAIGSAGVAIVRLSGARAFEVAERVAGRRIRTGVQFVKMPLDECLVLGFKSPKSYTGEDCVEFQCHGGRVTPQRILDALLSSGARLAQRGEFTRRAFLNGKLDYDQAESVLELIHAKTERAADIALAGLRGERNKSFRELYDRAIALSSHLEHALDVFEDELPESFYAQTERACRELEEESRQIIRRSREGKILREGALVVLAGPPNAGKSSLMNALLNENRAIVSDIPGTTRDSIEEWLSIDGYPIRLVDTAGLRASDDAIESEGVRRAEKLIASAQIVLRFTEEKTDDAREIAVCGKADILSSDRKRDLREKGVRVHSAVTGEGLEELKVAITERLRQLFAASEGETACFEDDTSLAVLREALFLLTASAHDDLVLLATDVRRFAERVGELIGATYSSDLLDALFSRFCVGK